MERSKFLHVIQVCAYISSHLAYEKIHAIVIHFTQLSSISCNCHPFHAIAIHFNPIYRVVQLRIANPIPPKNSKDSQISTDLWVDREIGLICTLTTHRIVFCRNELDPRSVKTSSGGISPKACFIDLCMVSTAAPSGHGYMHNAKILLSTFCYGDVSLVFESESGARKDRDRMFESLSTCLSRRAWLDKARQQLKLKASKEKTNTRVGVDAIIAKNNERHEDAKRVSQNAFKSDVDGLMREGRQLVLVINQYVATLDRRKGDTKDMNEKKAADEEEQKLTELLSNMGMMSALSKKAAGSLYLQQLSRQLAEFLRCNKTLMRDTGVITLTDAYCLFNRARGANLVSAGEHHFQPDNA